MSDTRLDPGPQRDSARSGSVPGGVGAPGRAQIAERTLRTDRWWIQPAVVFTLLTLWVLYALVRTAAQTAYYVEEYGYLTPFYSPCLTASCVPGARHFGTWFGEFPPLVPYALLILPFLLGFRLTCYYYRRAYYRSFWLAPPACAVALHKAIGGKAELVWLNAGHHTAALFLFSEMERMARFFRGEQFTK